MQTNTTGGYNSAFGANALDSNVSGNYNTAIGMQAGYSSTGNNNVFIGYEAGYNETGSNKLYIGNHRSTNLITGDFSTGDLSLGQSSGTVSGFKRFIYNWRFKSYRGFKC